MNTKHTCWECGSDELLHYEDDLYHCTRCGAGVETSRPLHQEDWGHNTDIWTAIGRVIWLALAVGAVIGLIHLAGGMEEQMGEPNPIPYHLDKGGWGE